MSTATHPTADGPLHGTADPNLFVGRAGKLWYVYGRDSEGAVVGPLGTPQETRYEARMEADTIVREGRW